MLSQIVRPLVQTQIRLLANCQGTQATLIETIVRWLSYLGMSAQVNSLKSDADSITVSLTVGKPEGCNSLDWQQIIHKLHLDGPLHQGQDSFEQMELAEQLQMVRLLAYLIQVGQSSEKVSWEAVKPQLISLELSESLLAGIRSALKIPQSIEMIEKLNPDVVARAFPIAVKIAWLDRQINPQESQALTALLKAMT
ncbi:MAG: hypothetical protein AB4426_29635 [Xenococcaceae cyanobacterium]